MQNPVLETLIIRYLSNEVTEGERLELQRWLAQDPAHQSEFNRLQAAWNTQLQRPSFDTATALHKLNGRIDEYEQRDKTKRMPWIYWRVAAGIVLAVSVGLLAFFFVRSSQPQVELSFREVVTLPGQKNRVRLTDGTVIRLNSNSKLRFPEVFSSEWREVTLEGEAFFEVAKDSLHPFLVRTGSIQTRVLGTAFNIRSTSASVAVTVAEGKVAVADSGAYYELLPFDKLTFSKNNNSWRKEKTDLERELAWQRNKLIFDNEPVSDVVRVLADWYGVRFTLDNEAIGRCRITGTFTNETLENVLKAMSFSLEIQYVIKNKEVTLRGSGC
jgi:ferric-dicitrate binding protein FerR (iron transport regulator)